MKHCPQPADCQQVGRCLNGCTASQQRRDSGAQVRIISDYKTFIRECYDWWRDGCSCLACRVVDLYEQDRLHHAIFEARMEMLADTVQCRHGDGVHLFGDWNQYALTLPSPGDRQREQSISNLATLHGHRPLQAPRGSSPRRP